MKYFSLIFLFALAGCSAQETTINYPTIPYESVTVGQEGNSYIEHFRNLEQVSDTIIAKWVGLQNQRTKDKLWSTPGKEKWTTLIEDIANRYASPPYMFRHGEEGSSFYLKYKIDGDITSLYSFDEKTDTEKLIIATDSLSNAHNAPYYLSYYQPSWNGKYLAVEFNDFSGLTGILLLVDASTGKLLCEPIKNTSPSGFGGISWLPDSSGILYHRFPVIDSNLEGYKQNSASYLYKIGDKGIGKPVFSSDIVKANDPKVYPHIITTSSHEKYAIGFLTSSHDYWAAYIADWSSLGSGTPNWKPLYKLEDKVFTSNFKQVNEKFYFISGKSENFNISYVDLDNDSWNPKVLIEAPNGETISDFVINSNGIYFSSLTNGVLAKLYHLEENGKPIEIEPPQKSGHIDLEVLSPTENVLWAYTKGWISELKRYRLTSDNSFVVDDYDSEDVFSEFKSLEVIETEYSSKDGVLVPISIIRNPEHKGPRPTIMSVYGAFGESLSPSFSSLFLTWVAQGGTLVYPHIRGGGEKGVSWYEGGFKSTKKNSWGDIISAAEFLIENKYSGKTDIVLEASSAGGVAGGMAINEAPELFAGFISQMALLNPSRVEFGNFSNSWELEFGSVKKPSEEQFLYAMDPLLNIDLKKNYPNVLALSAGNDDRVEDFQIFKYIATLQKFNNAKSVYLYNDPEAGHTQIDDIYNVYGMIFGFAESITE